MAVGGAYSVTAADAAEAVRELGAKRAIPIRFRDMVGSRRDARPSERLHAVPVEILEPIG